MVFESFLCQTYRNIMLELVLDVVDFVDNLLEWSALQLVAPRQSTDNELSGPLFTPLFFPHFPFSVTTFSHRRAV